VIVGLCNSFHGVPLGNRPADLFLPRQGDVVRVCEMMLRSNVLDTYGFQLIHVSSQNHFDEVPLWHTRNIPATFPRDCVLMVEAFLETAYTSVLWWYV